MQADQRPTVQGKIAYLALAWQKVFPRILIIRGMTFEYECLSEFAFILENNVEEESGDQELAFDNKKTECQKSHASVPLRQF